MKLKDRLAQIIYQKTDIFPHDRFVIYGAFLTALLVLLVLSLLGYFLYWRVTLPEMLDLESREYIERMGGGTR